MINKISSLTKRDIFRLFINGLDIDWVYMEKQHVNYPYYGEMSEIVFLSRLYNLKDLESLDPRYMDAESDIWQHTMNNDDYEYGWVFSDDRFPLKDGKDEELLRFLCEVFHPEVRIEKGYWNEYLKEVNRLLANDDIELYPINKISNHDVYGWRIISQNKNIYIPFSQRNMAAIKSSQLKFSLKKDYRKQLMKIFEAFNCLVSTTDETGCNYNSSIVKDTFSDISTYYVPMCYNDENKYVKAETFEDFILKTSPYCVFDAIEIYSRHSSQTDYAERVNVLLSLFEIPYSFNSGLMCDFVSVGLDDEQIGSAPEVGLTELLQKAQSFFNQGIKQEAVEKLWDAFERIKTINTDCDKKKSVQKIIGLISKQNHEYESLFKNEFTSLTEIGNKFRIRHHETNKIDINDEYYYNYFYSRCSSLLSLVLSYIK